METLQGEVMGRDGETELTDPRCEAKGQQRRETGGSPEGLYILLKRAVVIFIGDFHFNLRWNAV